MLIDWLLVIFFWLTALLTVGFCYVIIQLPLAKPIAILMFLYYLTFIPDCYYFLRRSRN